MNAPRIDRLAAWRAAMAAESVATVAYAAAEVATLADPQETAVVASVSSVASDGEQGSDCAEPVASDADGFGDWETEPDLPPLPDAEHQQAVGGFLRAALMRPASWSDRPDCRPAQGAWRGGCGRNPPEYGGRWWQEREAPKGWRCWGCHPPDHLQPENVIDVLT